MLRVELDYRLNVLRNQVRCEAAAQEVLRVFREVKERRLQEKYRPEQPRAQRHAKGRAMDRRSVERASMASGD